MQMCFSFGAWGRWEDKERFSRRRSIISVASRAPGFHAHLPDVASGLPEELRPGEQGADQALRDRSRCRHLKAARLSVPTRGWGTGQTPTRSQNPHCS